MIGDARRARRIRGLALIIGALSLVVVVVSAYLRLDAAGLGCVDWPGCYAGVLAGQPPALHYGFARLLHRIAASAALLLTVVLVWQCLRPRPLPPVGPALALLLLMLALSVLGFLSADPRRALVGFLNIVGGLGLVSFSWRVALAATPATGFGLGFGQALARRLPFRIGMVVLTLTVLFGAWLGATYSAAACPSLPFCDGSLRALAVGWPALNPLLSLNAAPPPGDAGGVLPHLLHRGFALLTLLVLGGAVLAECQRAGKKPAALSVLLLLLLVTVLGIAAIGSGLQLWLVVGHGAAAALLLAAAATLLRR